jgi:hypothetical protein
MSIPSTLTSKREQQREDVPEPRRHEFQFSVVDIVFRIPDCHPIAPSEHWSLPSQHMMNNFGRHHLHPPLANRIDAGGASAIDFDAFPASELLYAIPKLYRAPFSHRLTSCNRSV